MNASAVASAPAAPAAAAPARLARRAYARTRDGDPEVRWHLLDDYLPLVKSLVGRMRIYFPAHVDIDDIYSVAFAGLVEAVRRCEPSKRERFARFAALRVRGAILDELRRLDWMPRSVRAQAKRVRSVIERLEQEHGRQVTEEEVAEALELNLHDYRLLLDEIRPVTLVSLDRTPHPEAADSHPIHELIADDTELNARESTEKRELVQLLRDRLRELPEMHQKVLVMYYFENLRLAEIAEVFGVTESRICQIHTQAVLGLRTYLERVTAQ